MIYKSFGKTNIFLSALGFGAMRLPMTTLNQKKIVDYDKSTEMLHRAFELGVNYLDTAPGYCEADSENAVGKALKGWREKIYLATKNPIRDATSDGWQKRLEDSLIKLDVDYIDFYHMWGISLETFRNKIDVKDGPIYAARRALDQGLIKHLSFSFHDQAKNMIPIIDSGYFSSVLCQYNLLDRTNEDSIAYAKEKGLGVVVMGPVGGGRLGSPSDAIRHMIKKDIKSTAEMALRFVAANPNVDVVLSGMRNIKMLEENVEVLSTQSPLSLEESKKISIALNENKRLAELYCTGCNYCMPCPSGLNIPHIFKLMNYHRVYGLTEYARAEYKNLLKAVDQRETTWLKDKGADVSKCIECGQCQTKCPQKLPIISQLKETEAVLKAVT